MAHQLDGLLNDDALFEWVKADLLKRYPNSKSFGRHSTRLEAVPRMLVVKRLYGWSYEQTERFVSDSIVLSQFCRLYPELAPDGTTHIRWANSIGPETIAALNQRVVELACSLKLIRGRKLRIDTMVVETRIHQPTDSALLSDGIRVLSRLLRRAKKALPAEVVRSLGKEDFRTRNRSVRRTAQQLHWIAQHKRAKARKELKATYRKLLTISQAGYTQVSRVLKVLGAYAGDIEAAHCALVYLPPYSPDFNRIELAFSKLKTYLRQVQARTQEVLDAARGRTRGVRYWHARHSLSQPCSHGV